MKDRTRNARRGSPLNAGKVTPHLPIEPIPLSKHPECGAYFPRFEKCPRCGKVARAEDACN